jgi:hypothetical protein
MWRGLIELGVRLALYSNTEKRYHFAIILRPELLTNHGLGTSRESGVDVLELP